MGSEAHDRPRLTPKGERTRARIVAAAARLIYERGVAGTTLEDVRTAAEVSGSQLSHYFAGKDELVQAVIDRQADAIAGNQEQADLGTPRGSGPGGTWSSPRPRAPAAREAAPSGRSAASSPRTTRRPAP